MSGDPTRRAYAGAGQCWADHAMLAYGPLAAHLVELCPLPLGGATALDAGAGTGAVGAILRDRGAFVVACDLEADMLRHSIRRPGNGAVAVADVAALPLRSGSFDVVLAAFVLNHVVDPAGALRELRRLTRRGGYVLASVFGEHRAPAKDAVDEVLTNHGWQPPRWARTLHERAAAVATPHLMAAAARAGGWPDIDICADIAEVDVGLDSADLVVRYRLGMPQVSSFYSGLHAAAQAAVFAQATRAVEQVGCSFRPAVVELVARVS